mgnify:CR=1 FL=1
MVSKQVLNNLIKLTIGIAVITSHYAFALTSVTASVDKNPVTIKESIVLTVVADDDVDANALNTSALLKDFIVGRTSVSTQTSMVNFQTSRSTRWTTVLIARKAGTVTIPALTVDNVRTQPIEVKVLAADDKNAAKQQDIFITNEISSDNIYVQQQLTLTVKLHFSAELKRGSLTEPTLIGANIVQIGKDQESEQIINGKRFRVIERTYAINPQESGEFNILSARFSGEIMMPSARRSNFLSFAETKPVSVVGDDIPLTVRPIPVSYQGQWLPSEILTLHQEWQPNPNNFKVGEPITRTISLTAAGLSKEQLPKITFEVPRGLKVYPDQAELHSSLTKDRFVSQQVQNFAIVASRAGEYELPAITIPWFNTVTNRTEQAQLPAQTITVQANTDFPEEITPTLPAENNQVDNVVNTPSSETAAQAAQVIYQTSWLQWLFLVLWLLTSFAWAFSAYLRKKYFKQATGNDKNVSKIVASANSKIYPTLINACKDNNGEQVLSLLVPWVNNIANPEQKAASLDEAVTLVSNENIAEEIKELQQHLYGKSVSNWQGETLANLIKTVNKQGIAKVSSDSLNLNP